MSRLSLLLLLGLCCCLLLSLSLASALSLPDAAGASSVSAHRVSSSSAAGGWGQSAPGTLWNVSFTRPEGGRWFLLYFPQSLNATAQVPLAFFFHGYTGDAFNYFRYYGGFDGAERHRMAVVSGQGTNGGGNQPLGWNSGICCHFSSPPQQWPNDVQFALTALSLADAVLKANHSASVDRSRVFSMGMSNGGMQSERLGCEQPHVFRAVASVTGVTVESPGGLAGLSTCTQLYSNVTLSRSFSVLLVHGTADPHRALEWHRTTPPLPSRAGGRGELAGSHGLLGVVQPDARGRQLQQRRVAGMCAAGLTAGAGDCRGRRPRLVQHSGLLVHRLRACLFRALPRRWRRRRRRRRHRRVVQPHRHHRRSPRRSAPRGSGGRSWLLPLAQTARAARVHWVAAATPPTTSRSMASRARASTSCRSETEQRGGQRRLGGGLLKKELISSADTGHVELGRRCAAASSPSPALQAL